MENLEVNRISLYLSGKLPPYYKPFDKMEFMEELMGFFSDNFNENTFGFIQTQSNSDEQFYSMSLNKAKRIDEEKLILFLDKIKVIEDARYVISSKIELPYIKDKSILEKENLELKEKISSLTKPLVITEGKTDVKILETAWKKLYPDKTCPFEIIENGFEISEDVLKSGGADGLRNQLNFSSVYGKQRVIIGLFDNDKEGNDKFKGLDKNIFGEYNISNDVRKHKNYNIYGLLLVPPLFREKFISKTSAAKRFFQIEHYFSDEILKNYNMIKTDETFSNGIFEIGNSKDAFSKSIEKLDSSEFKNFSVLFDRIKSYI